MLTICQVSTNSHVPTVNRTFFSVLSFLHKSLRQLEKYIFMSSLHLFCPGALPTRHTLGSCPDAELDPVCALAQG